MLAQELAKTDPKAFAEFRQRLLDKGLRDEVAADREEVRAAEAQRKQLEHGGMAQAAPGCRVEVRYIWQVLRDFPEQVFAQTLLGFETVAASMAANDDLWVGINFVRPEDDFVAMRDYTLQMKIVGYLHTVYPGVPISLPFSKLIGALRGEETTTLSCHPHCSLGTYLFVDQNRKAVPVTQFVDVGPMLREMDALARKANKRRVQFFTKISAWNNLRKFFHEEKAPQDLTFTKFLQTLQGMTDKKYGRGESESSGFTYRTLMLAGMHFMDSYNYDIERVKRCVIHYAAPNGLIYPFCAYNSGPVYRERIEKEFSIPFETQEAMRNLTVKAKKGCGTCASEPELVG